MTERADCSGLGQATDYTVSAVKGDTLTLCLGTTGVATLTRITNMRRYPLVINPGTATTDYKAAGASWVSDVATGGRSFSLPSGATADLRLSGPTRVSTQWDGVANSVTALQIGAEALTTIVTRGKAGSGALATARTASEWLGAVMGKDECRRALLDLAHLDGAAAIKCLSDWDTLKKLYPADADVIFMLQVLLQAAGLVSWLLSQASSIADLATGHDQFTAVISAVAGPNDAEWWGNQTIPTGWESGNTIRLQNGKVASCSAAYCQYSVQSLTVQPAAAGRAATATIVLFLHGADGYPLAQTLLVMAADAGGPVLRYASDTGTLLPANRALCRRTTAVSQPNGDVLQTFASCPDPSGAGSQVWHLSGARLSLG